MLGMITRRGWHLMFNTVHAVDAYLDEREKLGVKPGLQRVKALLEDAGFYQQPFKAIHIAGTNGKGSTVAYLSACYRACGDNVGTFTSPTLTNRQAMIQLNHQPISDDDYLALINRLYPTVVKLDHVDDQASSFEILVAVAFIYFQSAADIACIEAGLGGREDATNVFTPIASVITSIGYDHENFLGTSLAEIAAHKSGIIKEKVPIIVGEVDKEALTVIKKEARRLHAPIYLYGEQFSVIEERREIFYQSFNLKMPLRLQMKGKHQAHNAAVAIKTLFALNQLGENVCISEIKNGIAAAQLAGRYEAVSKNPTIIIDGAHNTEAITAFVDTVRNDIKKDQPVTVLFAAFKDKPITLMLEKLVELTNDIQLTSFDHPRAASLETLAESVPKLLKTTLVDDWQAYLSKKMENAEDNHVTYVVGSLDFVGKVRQYIGAIVLQK